MNSLFDDLEKGLRQARDYETYSVESTFDSFVKENDVKRKIKLKEVVNLPDKTEDDPKEKSEESALEIGATIAVVSAVALPAIVKGITTLSDYIRKQQNSDVENFWSNNKHVKVFVKDGIVTIKKMNYRALMFRIEERYTENVIKLFDINYNPGDLKKYEKKKIATKKEMRIKDIQFKEFFSIEMISLFEHLADSYDIPEYRAIIKQIIDKTYLSKMVTVNRYTVPLTSTTKKVFSEYPPLKHQEEFIELYPYLKESMSLRGFILSFDQGLGKTLTSLALGTNLNKEQFIIVCPNTLTSVWADEIVDKMSTYKDNLEKAKEDIFVLNDKTKRYLTAEDPKFLIVNNEAVDKLGPHLNYSKDTIVIIDECQNYRYLNGQRWGFLIGMIESFYKKNKKFDVLCMSGTPIKAKPSEICPALMCIDPHFDLEAAKIYAKAFDVDSIAASEIISKRFGSIMYRKTKEQVLKLPPKFISSVLLRVENSDRFLLEVVKREIRIRFIELYREKLKEVKDYASDYEKYIKKYCSKTCPKRLMDGYLNYLRQTIIKGKEVELHELTLEEFMTFVNRYVRPNITDKEELKKFEALEAKYSHVRNSAMGLAIGEILPKRRDEMFIAMIKENENNILELIGNAEKKVALFTSSRKVVTALEELCNKYEIGHVTITGDNPKERAALIDEFKNDDTIEVLIGTNKTLGTGITITCANVEIIFGPPWRKADFDQLTDRIYRIGQTSTCYIYNMELDTQKPNLSNRMNEIMTWSGTMTNSYIDETTLSTEAALASNEVVFKTTN